jgi:hypothetical protein
MVGKWYRSVYNRLKDSMNVVVVGIILLGTSASTTLNGNRTCVWVIGIMSMIDDTFFLWKDSSTTPLFVGRGAGAGTAATIVVLGGLGMKRGLDGCRMEEYQQANKGKYPKKIAPPPLGARGGWRCWWSELTAVHHHRHHYSDRNVQSKNFQCMAGLL